MNYLIKLLLLSLLLKIIYAYDVVGWYVGDNIDRLDNINWDIYTTLRLGNLNILENGTVLGCDYSNKVFVKALELARLNNKTITLSAKFGNCKWKDTNETTIEFCNTYLKTLGDGIKSCGTNIAGIEFDHEGDNEKYLKNTGIVSKEEAKWFTNLMDTMQQQMGDNYTVSEDIGVWGLDSIIGTGSDYVLITPWIDVEILKKNKNLYVNTMSYHWPKDCSIKPWIRDMYVVNKLWGIPKSQINIGIPFYSLNHTNKFLPWKYTNEPTLYTLNKFCNNITYNQCQCNGIYFISKKQSKEIAELVKKNKFRGLFPWTANYDSVNNSRINYIGLGLGI